MIMGWMEKNWPSWMERHLKETLPDLRIERDAPMSRYTSFRIGGPAALLIFPRSSDELCKILAYSAVCGVAPVIVGKGTDLLVADEGLLQPVLRLTEMKSIRRISEDILEAQSGVSLASLAAAACKMNLSGLEFAHGIPGSLGGALYMNAGAYDGEMKQLVLQVQALHRCGKYWKTLTLSNEECDFAYRHSLFSSGDYIILSAQLRLQPGEEKAIRSKMDELAARRKESQPLEYPSAGSVFKRPEGYFAGTLIQKAGLKGLRVGGAQVSEKHAGFIVNAGDASAEDVKALIRQIQDTVYKDTGVQLEPEICFLG